MESSAERRFPVRTRRDGNAPSTAASASPSPGMAPSFFVPHAAYMSASAGGGDRTSGNLAPSRQLRLPRRLSPSCGRSPDASPATVQTDAAASSSAPADDASRLPLDLLEPAAARWASTAGRGGCWAPRVRSTLGLQSEVVDTGVFVCPDTVVAALYSAEPGRAHVVVTAESGGWLRVREQKTGTIRHQQQLRDGGELSCLAWASVAGDTAVEPFGAVIVAGQLSGLISFYALVGESLVELPFATCVFHEAPLLSCLPLRVPASALGPTAPRTSGLATALLSVDADGVVALWCLQAVEAGGGAGRQGEAEKRFSAVLLDCRHASLPSPGRCLADARVQNREGASPSPPLPAPPVVVAAAALAHPSPSPCCVLSTHRFAQEPLSPAGAPSDDSEADAAGALSCAAVLLYSFAASAADLNATTLVTDTGASTGLEDRVPVPSDEQPCLQWGWEVLRVYQVPVALWQQRGAGARAASAPVVVTALCITGCVSRSGTAVPAGQLWAGTTDGCLLVWEAYTGQFVRCLHSASAAPVHSLTSVPPPGSAGQALVWASQANGKVVAWSADMYTVAEVLPVSYPPPGPRVKRNGDAGGSMNGIDPVDQVVTVCDAIDLLRATRHCCAPLTSPAPWRRGCDFTLFVEPMEQVCMQRAWSVASDGTVRTWLLPTGSASSDGAMAGTAIASAASAPTGDAESAAPAASLDIYTVQRYLQDRANALVRERQAQRKEAESQQEQLQILQERNRVLAAALQQAISRLERVGMDALVRSASRPALSPSTAPSHDRDGAGATPEEPAGSSPDSPTTTTSTRALSDVAGAEKQPAVVAEASTAVVMAPEVAVPPQRQLTMAPSTVQLHVHTIQELLQVLHVKLEESWSRNDALREELLKYQLRSLEQEEDVVRRLRAAAVVATQGTEESGRTIRGMAAPPATPALSPLRPSPHTATSSLSEGTRDSCAQTGGYRHGDRAPTPLPPQTCVAPKAARANVTGRNTPSRTFCSPSVEELLNLRVSPLRPLSPPPPLEVLSAAVSSTSSMKPRTTPPSSIGASLSTATAAERFFKAASAMLNSSTPTHGGAVGRARVPTPPVLVVTAEEGARATEGDYTGSDDEGEPALLEAWCTSEGDLSPIPGPSAFAGGRGATSRDASDVYVGRHQRLSSSLFFPFTSTSFSADQTAGGSGGATYRPCETCAAPSPTRLAATWTTSARAAGRGDSVTDDVRAPVPGAPSCRPGSLAVSNAPPGAVATGAVQGGSMPRASLTSAGGALQRAFRSPIIYRPL
ncbi:hypothetical protein LSCM1_06476 [Leishmania martiniquensis]|uniref:Uncharacterized protein n=1 Tax=Leishmania martiniquensis TaxID=1580590 RepID=A0A836KNW7_9TRYP|nr:hypothetical protein LSCM1_06476 [Leishmania martiniquensis]